MDVLCIGRAAWDLILPLEQFPVEDSKIEIASLAESGGGPSANAAYLLSKWGSACGFAGIVGDDEHGERFLNEFRDIGTDISLVEQRHGYLTPWSVILVNRSNGSRTIINRRRQAEPLQLGPTAASVDPRILLFDGHELTASLQALARFPQAKSILDAGSLRDATRELAQRVDFLVASEKFARQVTESAPLDTPLSRSAAIAALYRMSGKPVVITLGSRGLIHGTDAGCQHFPAFPVKPEDTTAAGDIFHGAFAYGVLFGMGWDDLLRFASMAAALSVAVPGGRNSIPRLDEVTEALKRRS